MKFLSSIVLPLILSSAAHAYEVMHPVEEFGNLPIYEERRSLGLTVADLAFSISEFFKVRVYVFKDRSAPPAAGDYLELLNDAERALIIYHDCYEGGCGKVPLLQFSCEISLNICEKPRFVIRGEEVSYQEFLSRGDFNLN